MIHFPAIKEKRYALYPRRYTNEYHYQRTSPMPSFRSALGTLANARVAALRAIENYGLHAVRIFDRRTGQYVATYTGRKGIIRSHQGYVK